LHPIPQRYTEHSDRVEKDWKKEDVRELGKPPKCLPSNLFLSCCAATGSGNSPSFSL